MKPAFTFILCVVFFNLTAQNRLYVNHAATGLNNGQSWTDAFQDLQNAIQTAQMGNEIWVAEGIYRPTGTQDRNISFEPLSGVGLYGGFAGIENELSQRDWVAHPTVLSGDIGVAGDSTDNSYNVVYMFEPDSNTMINGFFIRDGVADEQTANPFFRTRSGGGIYIMGENGYAYPEIRNCVFLHNTAVNYGGGVMVYGGNNGSVAPRMVNCRFEANFAGGYGGGLSRIGGSLIERGDDLADCVFYQNRSGYRGGGFYYRDNERKDILQWFKETPDAILTSVGILTTGFDEPTVESIILNRATRSLTLYFQMIGRGSRILPHKDTFTVIDLGNNLARFGRWDEEIDWQAIFRSPENYLQNVRNDAEIQRHFKYKMPPFLRERFGKTLDMSFDVDFEHQEALRKGLRPKVVIDKSIAQHAAMCMENAESLDEVRELARLLRDDVEYRVRLYSYCITKSTENYRTWLSDEYMRRLEAEVRVLWRVSVINAEE